MVPAHSTSIDLSVWHKEITGREAIAHAYFDFSETPEMPEKPSGKRYDQCYESTFPTKRLECMLLLPRTDIVVVFVAILLGSTIAERSSKLVHCTWNMRVCFLTHP